MSTHQFKTLTHEEGQDLLKSYSTKGGNCTAPSDAASFIFPTLDSSDAGWTAVYVCEGCGGEFFVEEFETKAQAILYLTTEDSAEEIREKYAPEPKLTGVPDAPKPPVHAPEKELAPIHRIYLHEVMIDHVDVRAKTLVEAEDAVRDALYDSDNELWKHLSFDESCETDVDNDGHYTMSDCECEERGIHGPEFEVVDGKLREWKPETRKRTPEEILAAVKEAMNETNFNVEESTDSYGKRLIYFTSAAGCRWASPTEATEAAYKACQKAIEAGWPKREPCIYTYSYPDGWIANAHMGGPSDRA